MSKALRVGVMLLLEALCAPTAGWTAIRVVMNEVERGDGTTTVVVTFIDESGNGIRRHLVRDASGAALSQGDLDCPRTYRTPPFVVRNDRFPLTAGSTECGESGAESAPAGYTYVTAMDLSTVIVVEPGAGGQTPCSEPLAVMEEAGSPCALGRGAVNDIAAEIEALCGELARHRRDALDHASQKDAYTAATAVLLVAALVCAIIATRVPWPVNLILGLVAAALFIAALVTGSLATYHLQEEERARRLVEETEGRLEDARSRYRAAVEAAIAQCCGHVPSGLVLDPPECGS